MTIRTYIVAATAVLACVAPALAAPVGSNEPIVRELTIYIGGTLILDNPVGDIDVIGTDDTKVVITAEKSVRALDKDALEEGKDQTQLALLGDARQRLIKAIIPPVHSSRWTSGMRFSVRVPRTVHVKISSAQATRIHVADMRASVTVKSFNGTVVLERLSGIVSVDGANSNVVFIAPDRGMSDAQLTSINGSIEVIAPPKSVFQWIAETLKGDTRTTFPVKGAFIGTRFRGSVNGNGGPNIITQSFNGNIFLLQQGSPVASAKPVRPADPTGPGAIVGGVEMRQFEKNVVNGFLRFSTNMGDIVVGAIHGGADLATGAGEVRLGTVFGDCQVVSHGGPLNLGQIIGTLSARTEAGDVSVQSIKSGGTITTGGGTIRLSFTGGPTRLQSGGGDIVVREASAAINAETQSGDITITVDADSKSERITAKTAKGSVVLNVIPAFAADIDATVITSDPAANNIVSDLSGLQFRREQVGGKTKIRATGKVNGGGDRIELYAEDGGIQISTRGHAPSTP